MGSIDAVYFKLSISTILSTFLRALNQNNNILTENKLELLRLVNAACPPLNNTWTFKGFNAL